MLLGKRTNCLLVKDDVGKAKPATRNLPENEFAFGKGSQYNESAGDGKKKFTAIDIFHNQRRYEVFWAQIR